MTNAQARRVEAARSSLQPKERAILAIRNWIKGENEDPLLRRSLPSDELAEFNKFVEVFYHANNAVFQDVAFWLEWLTLAEVVLAWLESLSTLLDRSDRLEAALGDKVAKLALPALPKPGRGVNRTLPWAEPEWGTPVDDPIPGDWHAMRDHLRYDTSRSIITRWGESVALDRALAEFDGLVGADVIRPDVRERIDACRSKVLELHAAWEAMNGPLELPEPSEANIETMRSRFDWEAFKPEAPPPLPQWMADKQQEELAAAEGRWAAELAEARS